MSWLNTPRFPEALSFGSSSGGPSLLITRVQVHSGRIYSNEEWDYPLHRYNAAYGVRTVEQLNELIEFYIAVGANKFRYKDWFDYKSCAPDETAAFDDQSLGTGDGNETDFPIFKTYVTGAMSRQRPIIAPVESGFLVGVDGSNQASGWSLVKVDDIYVVRFDSAPTNGDTLTWGGAFDVPVQFNLEHLQISLDSFNTRSLNVPVVEARLLD